MLIPLVALFLKAAGVPFDEIVKIATATRTLNAL